MHLIPLPSPASLLLSSLGDNVNFRPVKVLEVPKIPNFESREAIESHVENLTMSVKVATFDARLIIESSHEETIIPKRKTARCHNTQEPEASLQALLPRVKTKSRQAFAPTDVCDMPKVVLPLALQARIQREGRH